MHLRAHQHRAEGVRPTPRHVHKKGEISGFPTGRPYPSSGPGRTRGTRVYPLLCGSGWILRIPGFPTGRPHPPSGPGRTGGTPMYPPLSVRGCILCIPSLPRGVPIPHAAHAGLEGLGCIRRCVGVRGCGAYVVFPRGFPSPKWPREEAGLGCICCFVRRAGYSVNHNVPRGVPIPQVAKAGLEGLKCIGCCVGVA